MKHWYNARMLSVLIAGMIGILAQGGLRAVAEDTGESKDGSGVEVLTRGPVHEAFAEPNNDNTTQGVVVPKETPAAINEIPPDQKPAGDALWIPGYWQWDSDRSDFIWISGIWRVPPPETSWSPGSWNAVAGGWSWTPGFWMASKTNEVTYLDPPPKSLEIGPSSPAPSADHIWSPGCWSWTEARYAWRPGHWLKARHDRVWMPAYYAHTPRGSVYIDGYWDWTIGRRGVLFAPAYIQRSMWGRPDYVYSPSIVIQTDLLTANLFVSPSYGHYYFGDYYDAQYSSGGIYPWFEFHNDHRGYDPIYAQERWSQSRTDSHWEEHQRENYDYRVKNVDARPPRLYSEQAAFAARAPQRERGNLQIAAPLSEVANRRNASMRYEKINATQRQSLGRQGKGLATNDYNQRAQGRSPGNQASTVRSTRAVSRNLKQTNPSARALSRNSGKVRSERSSKEPGQSQTNRASKRQDKVQIAQASGNKKSDHSNSHSKSVTKTKSGSKTKSASQTKSGSKVKSGSKAKSGSKSKSESKSGSKTSRSSASANHKGQGKKGKSNEKR